MGYNGVMGLAKEHPDWLLIVKACYEAAVEFDCFAGSQVFDKVGWEHWFPGLKRLEKYEILKHEGSTKRGAFWTIPNKNGVSRALHELEII